MEDLKKQKIWICWTLSKGTKKTISAHGTPTSANVRKHGHTYVTYEEALQAKEEKGYTGVGFVIPEGYFFLDIDHRPQDDPLCQTLFERFTYEEALQAKEEKGYTGVGFVIPEGYFFLDIDHRPQDDPLCQTLFERFDYEEALQAKEEKGYTGVGFVIPEGYFFLDIDHRPQDDPLCQTLFERFDSYCERSQSKEGFHIYGKCDLSQIPQANGKLASRFYTNNRLLGLEIYIGGLTSRFACFTDDVFKDLPIADCTQSLLVTLRHEMLKQEVTRKHVSEVHGDDEELFDMICDCRRFKNGENFIKLYDKGDWS